MKSGDRPEPGGIIAHLGLSRWWINEFSDEERNYIRTRYVPLSTNVATVNLDDGDVSVTLSAQDFLRALATWLPTTLSKRCTQKAEELVATDLDTIFGDHRFLGPFLERVDERPLAPLPTINEPPFVYQLRLELWCKSELERGTPFWFISEALGTFLSSRISCQDWNREQNQAIDLVQSKLSDWHLQRSKWLAELDESGEMVKACSVRSHLYFHDLWPGHSLRERLRIDLWKLERFDDAIRVVAESIKRKKLMLKPQPKAIQEDEELLRKLVTRRDRSKHA